MSTPLSIVLGDWHVSQWTWKMIPLFTASIMIGMEGLSVLIPLYFERLAKKETIKSIPVKGKHLDKFDFLDRLFININKVLTVLFVYHVLLFLSSDYSSKVEFDFSKITFFNTIGSLVGFYIFYDFFYAIFHYILHIRSLYPLVHKHHHRQKAPSRGNLDAINVHPFEFVVGEYLHLLTIFAVPSHIVTVIFFILIGGILASLNHTRYDIDLFGIYVVKVHDVHHRLPESNYSQYTMFWDKIFGWYRPYDKVKTEEEDKSD